MSIKKMIVAGLLATFSLGCASTHSSSIPEPITPKVEDDKYNTVLSRFTKSDKRYNGFHNIYEAHATLLNSLVESTVLQQRGHFLQWDKAKTASEREKMFQNHSSKSHLLLSFFTPERSDNNLDKPKTIWKVYLLNNGQRYLGTVKRDTSSPSEIRMLFPHVNRWSKVYRVSFDAPMEVVEKKSSKVVITSSVGSSEFDFNSLD